MPDKQQRRRRAPRGRRARGRPRCGAGPAAGVPASGGRGGAKRGAAPGRSSLGRFPGPTSAVPGGRRTALVRSSLVSRGTGSAGSGASAAADPPAASGMRAEREGVAVPGASGGSSYRGAPSAAGGRDSGGSGYRDASGAGSAAPGRSPRLPVLRFARTGSGSPPGWMGPAGATPRRPGSLTARPARRSPAGRRSAVVPTTGRAELGRPGRAHRQDLVPSATVPAGRWTATEPATPGRPRAVGRAATTGDTSAPTSPGRRGATVRRLAARGPCHRAGSAGGPTKPLSGRPGSRAARRAWFGQGQAGAWR